MAQRKTSVTVKSASQALQFRCPIYADQMIGDPHCTYQTRIISKNMIYCNRLSCASPWRLCIFCLRQGVTSKEAVVKEAALGLCEFHKMNGPGAQRGIVPYRRAEDEEGPDVQKIAKYLHVRYSKYSANPF